MNALAVRSQREIPIWSVKTSDFRDQFGVHQWMERSRVITSLDFSPDIFEREHPEKAVCFRASFSRFGPTSIGAWTFDAVLQQLACLGVDTDFVCHAIILDIEGIA